VTHAPIDPGDPASIKATALITRYGHCKFTDAEVLAAFAVLVLKVSGYNLLVSGDVLPGSQAQAEFLRLSRRYGASPVLTPPTSLR